ncbi:MAG: outer membrane beta-barrel protein [Acetobacteraceae bacterium]|nr:outer membrane beta-barrel protein [Acetobacteraceae bacterium]
MIRRLLLISPLLVAAGTALAQSVSNVVLTPLNAPRPAETGDRENLDFFRTGATVRLGPFFVLPLFQTTVGLDDNVLSQRRSRRADGLLRVGPAVIARTTWSRHAIQAEASLEGVKYASFNRLDAVNARAGTIGRLDLWRDSFLQLNAFYLRTNDLPTDQGFTSGVFGVPLAQLAPSITERSGSGLLLALQEGRVESQSRLDWQRTSSRAQAEAAFQGIGAVNAFTITQRLGYRITEGRTAYLEASGNIRRSASINVDSQGFRIAAGLRGELTRLLNGEVSVGVLRQDFASGRSQTNLAFTGSLFWRPTALTNVTLLARRDVGEAGGVTATANGFTGSGTLTTAMLSADHSLSQAWVVQGLVRMDRLERVTTGQGDITLYGVQLGTTYALNRQLSAIGLYRFLLREGGGPDTGFARNQFLVGLRGTL